MPLPAEPILTMNTTQQTKPKTNGTHGLTRIASMGGEWICFCKNTPQYDGFYPCDPDGNEVEPTPEEWTTNWYVCTRCGRMIDQQTLRVVGVRYANAVSLDEQIRIWEEVKEYGYPAPEK